MSRKSLLLTTMIIVLMASLVGLPFTKGVRAQGPSAAGASGPAFMDRGHTGSGPNQGGMSAVVLPTGPSALLDYTEGFDDITTLPAADWALINHSEPVGTTSWFQGNDTVFPAQAGAPTAYIGANFNNTSGSGTISNWLLMPTTTIQNGSELKFWTRSPTGSTWADRLQVRMSSAGTSTNVGTTSTDVGDFTTLLLDINSTLAGSGYPQTWTEYTVTVSGLAAPVTGRLAFRYFVTNGGPSGANSDYIGIDTVSYVIGAGATATPTATAVPPTMTATVPPTVTATVPATATTPPTSIELGNFDNGGSPMGGWLIAVGGLALVALGLIARRR